MAAENSTRRNSNTQLLQELEELSQSLYQTHTTTNRRTASLALPRSSIPAITADDEIVTAKAVDHKINGRPRSRRMSLSPWRSRPKLDDELEEQKVQTKILSPDISDNVVVEEKKGIWGWKPIRALTHIGKQKLSCLFSVEVVTAQGLPASMNGLRLSVCVRKKETRDGAVHTMPSRVSQGAADFEETLFVKCHVYCTSPTNGKLTKFEPRPFWIYVFAVDAEELDFGKNSVDLSQLIQESVEKNFEGTRVRQWDTSFKLSGKAKGGELVLKLGFQIMEKDGGIGIYSQSEGLKAGSTRSALSFARKQSKSSFSVPSPKMSSRGEAWTPSPSQPKTTSTTDIQGMDELNLDEPAPVPSSTASVQKSEDQEAKIEDLDLDFEVVDKGVEMQDREEDDGESKSEGNTEEKSASSEVVKEVVHDQVHMARLSELDSIAQQIKALESMMGEENAVKADEESASPRLEADEEDVTKEFLQMLEDEDGADADEFTFNPQAKIPALQLEGAEDSTEGESKVYVPDLGKGLGCVVQTRNGGYLAAMNPLDVTVGRREIPKLAMQISKPMVLELHKSINGFELFQRMAGIGLDELSSQILTLMPIDELMDKTAEQIAFEGIASAIIQGRNKEGASSSAARTVAAVKSMANAMSTGRKERIATGIWNVTETPLALEEILAISLQKVEAMAVEALKIQADIAEEEAPFEVSPLKGKTVSGSGKEEDHPLASAVPLEDWIKKNEFANSEVAETITVAMVVQLRDPIRRYEVVGGPMVALLHVTGTEIKSSKYDEEKRFKVSSLHVGGLKVRTGGKRNVWDSEKQRLTAMQWLVAYGLGKTGKRGKNAMAKGQDLLWSISSRVMADMWLKSMRNPDVKFAK